MGVGILVMWEGGGGGQHRFKIAYVVCERSHSSPAIQRANTFKTSKASIPQMQVQCVKRVVTIS